MHIKKLTYDTTDIAVDWDKDFFPPKTPNRVNQILVRKINEPWSIPYNIDNLSILDGWEFSK